MLCCSILSHNLIENPLRRSKWSVRPVFAIAYGGILSCVSAVAVYFSLAYSQAIYLGEIATSWIGISSEKCFSGSKYSGQELLEFCTLRPNSNSAPTVIAIGDSQTGHLLSLLNRLHSESGVGVKFYTQADINFPAIRESGSDYSRNLQEFDSRYQRHLDAYKTFVDSSKKGDILLISSRFDKRWGVSPETNSKGALPVYFDYKNNQYKSGKAYIAWKQSLGTIINHAAGKGIHTIIFTSFPRITGSIPMCVSNPQWFNDFAWCNVIKSNVSRTAIVDNAKPVISAFRIIANANNNVYLFDQFNALCPPQADKCIPWYTADGIHLSPKGTFNLYDHFKHFLFAKRLLIQ